MHWYYREELVKDSYSYVKIIYHICVGLKLFSLGLSIIDNYIKMYFSFRIILSEKSNMCNNVIRIIVKKVKCHYSSSKSLVTRAKLKPKKKGKRRLI